MADTVMTQLPCQRRSTMDAVVMSRRQGGVPITPRPAHGWLTPQVTRAVVASGRQ